MSTFEKIAAIALVVQGFAFIGAWLKAQGREEAAQAAAAKQQDVTNRIHEKVADVLADHEARLQVVEDRTGGLRRTG